MGPDWDGVVSGDKFDGVLQAPTPWVWTVGRVFTRGGDDLEAAREIQSKFVVAPLSQWESGNIIPSTRRDVLDPFPKITMP